MRKIETHYNDNRRSEELVVNNIIDRLDDGKYFFE